ncbi:MAG: hypothetical protein ACI9FN_001122 [Saprospiraceae bacterium]|jgi:hypothetical protein
MLNKFLDKYSTKLKILKMVKYQEYKTLGILFEYNVLSFGY